MKKNNHLLFLILAWKQLFVIVFRGVFQNFKYLSALCTHQRCVQLQLQHLTGKFRATPYNLPSLLHSKTKVPLYQLILLTSTFFVNFMETQASGQ